MIVSDSSTLIILFDLDKIELLQNISNKVYIPQTVYNEINYKYIVNLPNYFEIIKITQNDELYQLKMLLDDGESEAILLARQMKLPLIIDEKKGRKIAKNLSLDILGLLGVVYLNIKKDFITIDDARGFIQKAKSNNYRISSKLIEEMFDNL